MRPVINFQGSATLSMMAIAATGLVLLALAYAARCNAARVRLLLSDGRTYQPYFGSGHRPTTPQVRSTEFTALLRQGGSAGGENRFFHPRAAFRTDAIHIERMTQR